MSPTVLRLRYELAKKKLGEDHPKVRALYGRYLISWAVPQRDASSIEAIAWHRAAGVSGYRNRTERRKCWH